MVCRIEAASRLRLVDDPLALPPTPESLMPIRRIQTLRLRALLAGLVICAPIVATAQEEWTPVRSFRTFSKSAWRGMPLSSVTVLAQDVDGVLWLGTFDGVATFDGRSITPVADVPEAPRRGLIGAIVARRSGGVYVATPAGIHLFDRERWTLKPTKAGPVSIAEGTDGTLWMTDSTGVLSTLSPDGSWQKHDAPEKLAALTFGADGLLWAATATSALSIRGSQIEAVSGAPLPLSLIHI